MCSRPPIIRTSSPPDHREKDKLIFGNKYQDILIFLILLSYVPNSRFVMTHVRHILSKLRCTMPGMSKIILKPALETLVWSDPANLAGEMIKNQNAVPAGRILYLLLLVGSGLAWDPLYCCWHEDIDIAPCAR